MYGDLQGLNKDEMRKKFGDEQVRIWRRSYDVAPPGGESLQDTAARVIPYWESKILPKLRAGKNILISAHGNSLRALVMYLEKLTKEQILETEIPTGIPKIYVLDKDLNVLEKKYL
jgi:2,3-bisphosphoglycerate-dependent phosphoglycerate mutase